MNEMNSLEGQLKSWRPRRPSAGLERSLFGTPLRGPRFVQAAGWLAPAVACLLFVGVIAKHPDGRTIRIGSDYEELVAMSLSNQSYAAYLPGSFKSEQNRWDTFEWTNGGSFTSSIHPFPKGRTDGSELR